MKLLRPTSVTDAILTSSTIAETDYGAWVTGSTYALGDRVIRTSTHRIYESLIASNTGNTPETEPTKWLDIGATNRWKMFDQAVGSSATATGDIVVVLAPGTIDCLAVLDLAADHVTVSMSAGGVEVYSRTQPTAIGGTSIDNWYSWFFEPIGTRSTLIFDDIPPFSTGVITVTIAGASEEAAVGVGTMIMGRMFSIGTTLSEPDIGFDDYSQKSRDDFGVVTLVERPYSDNFKAQVAVDSARASEIKRVIAGLRATATLWIGDENVDALIVYGFASSFSVTLQALTGISFASLEVQGLI